MGPQTLTRHAGTIRYVGDEDFSEHRVVHTCVGRTWIPARRSHAWLGSMLFALAVLSAGCSGGEETKPSVTVQATPSPTSAPRDPQAAEAALHKFAAAVQEGRVDDAWALYAASVPGDTAKHRSERGCDYGVFTYEFPQLQHLFQQTAPFTVVETFGSALGTNVVELSVRGADNTVYLATLAPMEPYSQDYQVMFLNSGHPAQVLGAPDPFPSPQYPQGFCGIWTGAR
jgi:hypothetical protein